MSDRSSLISAVVRYNLMLWLGGLASAILVPLSIGAGVLDVVAGRDDTNGLFAQVRDLGSTFSKALDPHNVTPSGAALDQSDERPADA